MENVDTAAARVAGLQEYVAGEIAPFAQGWDLEGRMPESAIRGMGGAGLLGLTLGKEWGGRGCSQAELGMVTEWVGAACSSARSLMTVHLSLVGETLARWGSAEQKQLWLPQMAKGEVVAAFGLSEPGRGSDAAHVETRYAEKGDGYVLNGVKKWVTFGQRADLYVIVARGADVENAPVSAFLVPRDTEGLRVVPIDGMVGTRASLLAELQLEDCVLPKSALLGRAGWGFMQIVNTALDNGRFSVGCGALGILRACLEASAAYANERVQYGKAIAEHQLIRQKLARMGTDLSAAGLMLREAARLRDGRKPEAILMTTGAKYFAAQAALRAADEAIQIHGAVGLHPDTAVQRYWRDAKVLGIIEGTNEMLELLLGASAAAQPSTFLTEWL